MIKPAAPWGRTSRTFSGGELKFSPAGLTRQRVSRSKLPVVVRSALASDSGFISSQLSSAPFCLQRNEAFRATEGSKDTPTKGRGDRLYTNAIRKAKTGQFDEARDAFEDLLKAHPEMCKAWVSYAQMEKRRYKNNPRSKFDRSKQILQRGMLVNRDSACLAQAWGLLELQKGNDQGAVMLLERSVKLDPKCSPVLNWKPVRLARSKLLTRRRHASC